MCMEFTEKGNNIELTTRACLLIGESPSEQVWDLSAAGGKGRI